MVADAMQTVSAQTQVLRFKAAMTAGAFLLCALASTPSNCSEFSETNLPDPIPPPPSLKTGDVVADMVYSPSNPYERAGEEPPSPRIQYGKTRAAFRLLWVDTLHYTIIVRIEIQSWDEAQIHAYSMTSAGQEEPVTMRSSLTQTEIRNVLADTEKYHFWAMPQAGASSQEATTVDGKTVVQACADGGSIRIEGFEGSINHEVIREDCGPRAGHEDALSFAGSLVRVAMAHFPNLPSHYFLEN